MAIAREGGRAPRLTANRLQVLREELRSPPARCGYRAERWTGALLADFLKQNYAITVTARHGRRLLARLGINGAPQRPLRKSAPDRVTASPSPIEPRAGLRAGRLDKDVALRRLRRLASSALPLAPFVTALWELLHAAIPFADNKVFLADPGANPSAYLMNNPELAKWVPVQRHYYIEAPPEVSGMRVRFGPEFLCRTGAKPVSRSEEFALPHFYRSEGYREFLHPLGFHHMLWVVFREAGRNLGYLPMWRGEKQPPFSRDEIRFLTLAAPHVAHGLALARLRDASAAVAAEEFVPAGFVGMAILDEDGRLLALDPAAEAIFLQLAVLSGEGGEPLLGGGHVPGRNHAPSAALFAYLSHVLRDIFGKGGAGSALPPPLLRIYSHRTGVALSLRGFAPRDVSGNRNFVVLIERGESRTHRRARTALRWGLSATDIALLDGLRAGLGNRGLAGHLKVTPGTAKAYALRLEDKLGLSSLSELRRFAYEVWV